jgi:uncharacterized membrane protein YqjE
LHDFAWVISTGVEDYMARPHNRIETDGVTAAPRTNGDASLRELLRQLADDGSALVRSEIALAKVEMKETGRQLALDGVKLVIALGLAGLGALALTAALIVGIGTALGGMYWVAALGVGLLFLVIGGVLAQRGISGLQGNSMKPEHTLRSLQQDRTMVQREARGIRDGLRS